MRRYELAPNGTQKSFYGKAIVEIDNAGNETLYSYNTPIIKAFCGLNKAGFMGLEHEPTPQEKAAAYNGTLYR